MSLKDISGIIPWRNKCLCVSLARVRLFGSQVSLAQLTFDVSFYAGHELN